MASPINSPTSTGEDVNSSGGSTSGETTSAMLVNTVRYHGISIRSPTMSPTGTGFELSCSGGRRSGATRSMTFKSSERQRETFSASGGANSMLFTAGLMITAWSDEQPAVSNQLSA